MSQKYVIRSLNRPIEEADRLRRENRTLRARLSRLSDFNLHVTASLDLETVQQSSWTESPWQSDSKRLLNAAAPQYRDYSYLAAWFGEAEHLWDTHGAGRMSFSEQLDYFGKLSAQFPASATKSAPSVRVFCAASGTLPAAVVLSQRKAVLEHALYWAATGKREAQYLTAILNNEAGRSRAAQMQSRSQWGTRDFNKLKFELPIPPVQRQRSLAS